MAPFFAYDTMKFLSFNKALYLLFTLAVLSVGFHGLVMLKVIPYSWVWGGRLKSFEQMRVFESISIFYQALILLMIAIRAEFIQRHVPFKTTHVFFWMFLIITVANLIGHLTSLKEFESKVFIPVEFIYLFLLIRLVREPLPQ